MTTAIRPSRIWYVIGAAVAFAGIVLAAVWVIIGVSDLIDRVDELQRVPLPGEGAVTFDEAGSYTVYVELPGAGNEERDIPEGEIFMESAEDGTAITFEDYDSTFTYDWSGHEGRAVLTFDIPEPGLYEVRTETDGFAEGEVAVGPSIVGRLPARIAIGAVGAFLALAGATAIIAVTAVRRSRARKALAPAPPTAGPGQPQQYPPQPYPQQPYPPARYPPPPPPPAPPPPPQQPQPPPQGPSGPTARGAQGFPPP